MTRKVAVALVGVIALAAGSTAANGSSSVATLSFAAPTTQSVGLRPRGVAVTDLNRDGRKDIVVAEDGGGLSVLLGKPGGGFAAPVTYAAGSEPTLVAVGDLNHDGRPDVVVSNYGESSVSVFLGKGALGKLSQQVKYATGIPARSAPIGLMLARLTTSKNLDLVVANSSEGTISVLLGNHNGTFQRQKIYTVSGTPRGIAIGDFNHDGKLDIAVCGIFNGFANGGVAVLFGNGSGTFGKRAYFPAGTNPYSIVAIDLNHDNRPDLLVTNAGSGNVSVLRNKGGGHFAYPINYGAGYSPYGLAVGDLNGDGKPDVVVGNVQGTTASVLLGNGNGTFQQPAQPFPAGAGGADVQIADLNHDGHPDLVVADFYSSPSVISILKNTSH